MTTILTEFARLVPISIQGIGVREATFAELTGLAGGSPEAGFVVCALLYGIKLCGGGDIGCCRRDFYLRPSAPRLELIPGPSGQHGAIGQRFHFDRVLANKPIRPRQRLHRKPAK